jgi:hypothetical protein
MVQIAEIERIKLRATYCNNIAVGLVLAGVFIPLFAYMQRSTEISAWLEAVFHGAPNPTDLNIATAVGPLGICVLALGIARGFREHAHKIIGELKD